MEIPLINNYHGTLVIIAPRLITAPGQYNGYHRISRRNVLRLRRELCGYTDCVCGGGTFGERGGVRLAVVTEDSDRNCIIDLGESDLGPPKADGVFK
jgi:hypothetical protein